VVARVDAVYTLLHHNFPSSLQRLGYLCTGESFL